MIYQPAPLSDFISRWPMLATGVPRNQSPEGQGRVVWVRSRCWRGWPAVVQAALSHREAAAADTAAQVVPHLLQLSDPLLEQRLPGRGHPRPVPLAGGDVEGKARESGSHLVEAEAHLLGRPDHGDPPEHSACEASTVPAGTGAGDQTQTLVVPQCRRSQSAAGRYLADRQQVLLIHALDLKSA